MNTLRKISVIVITIVSINTAKAQDWMSTYGPGSPAWCWQMQQQNNMIDMMNMQMQMNIHNFYHNQFNMVNQHMMNNPTAPLPGGILTYDGVYVTPESVDSYHREQVDCEKCEGGYNNRRIAHGGGRYSTISVRCSFCRGKGYVVRTVKKK